MKKFYFIFHLLLFIPIILISQNIKEVISANSRNISINETSKINEPVACVIWIDAPPTQQKYITATEYLCNKGVISSLQYSSLLSAKLFLEDISLLTYNSLFFNKNYTSYVDNFPSPFVDLDSLTLKEFNAVNAMLNLEYLDGIPCISRDYYLLGSNTNIKRGKAIRAFLEAWKISPNWNGYNENSNQDSWFLCDVKVNDLYYGYMQSAYQTGFLQDVINNNCGCSQCFNSGNIITLGEAYLILYRLMTGLGGTPPSIIDTIDYFVPNSFKLSNYSNNKSIDRGIFEHYSDLSFNIPGGGLPLFFSHSFHSNLSELPKLSYEFLPKIDKLWQSCIFPLGENWTHNYNIYILPVKSTYSFKDKRLIINWSDGTIQSYNSDIKEYETKGTYDKLTIDSVDISGNALKVKILKPDGTKFYFRRHLEELQVLQLERIEDRNSNTVSLSYEPGFQIPPYNSIRLKSVKDNVSQRALTFNYKSNSNDLISVVDNGGRTIQFDVDPNSHLLKSFKDQNQLQTNYNYGFNASDKMLLTEIQLPKGNKIKNSYFQRKLKSTTNDQYEIKVNWQQDYNKPNPSTFASLTINKNSQEYTSTITHDQFGNPVFILNPDGTSITYEYSNQSHPFTPTKILDNNLGLTYEYSLLDQYGNANYIIIKTLGVLTQSYSYKYNNFNQLTQYTLPKGNTTKYEYSTKGELEKIIYPDNTFTSYKYNSNGNLTSMSNPSGIKSIFSYNPYGNLEAVEFEGSGIKNKASYDIFSRITSITDPKGIKQNYQYDLVDNILNTTYDPVPGLNLITQYQYDNNYNLTKVISPRGLETRLNYDFNTDDLIQEVHGGLKTKNWTYNKDGSIKSFTNKGGFQFINSFAPSGDRLAGRLLSDSYNNYEYDSPFKRLYKVKHNGLDIVYSSYDQLQRITNIAAQLNGLPLDGVKYEYTENNKIKSIIYPSSRVIKYEYDNLDRLVQVIYKNDTLVKYSYLADSRLSKEIFLNRTRTEYNYDNSGRLLSITTRKSNNDTIVSISATLDLNGNHTSESIKMNLLGDYKYHPIGSIINYIYKSDENILQQTIGSDSNTYKYNNNNALTSINGTSGNISLEWDQKDKLLKYINLDSNKIIDFKYDGYGNRRLVGNTKYALDVLNDANVLEETELAGKVKSVFVHGLGLICRIDPVSDDVSFYHSDFRGSTLAITDKNQNITHQYLYDEFGKTYWDTAIGFKNPFQFVGKYGIMKDESGLYYMRARYYDPSLGRFISEDPVWGTNLFPYADNSPIMNIDKDGAEPDPWTVSGQWAGISESINEGKPLEAGLYTLALLGSGADLALDFITLGESTVIRNLVEKGAKKAVVKYSTHASERMIQYGVNKKMVEKAISKGVKYYDSKEKSEVYILRKGFTSGKDIGVATIPGTYRVKTVMKGKRVLKPRFKLIR